MNDFLIITTVLVELKQFEESQRVHAEDARLKIELDLIGKKDGDEVCLLEARSIRGTEADASTLFRESQNAYCIWSHTVSSINKP
jgi:hypothetical protein